MLVYHTEMIHAELPHHFGDWLSQLLDGPIPIESEAPCGECVMCSPSPHVEPRFHPETKCCTYFPYLPNFLVGKIFLDQDPAFAEGRSAFIKVFQERTAVITPLGVDPPLNYQQRYSPHTGFGEQLELRCPYYLNGSCGIWKYRNSKCATWFCRYVKGQSGFEFWKSVDELLSLVQRRLSSWCSRELRAGTIETSSPIFVYISGLFQKMQDPNALPGWQHQTWGDWLGREQEYFEECSRLVEPLEWQDVRMIVGGEIQSLEEQLKTAYSNLLDHQLPTVLKLGSYRRVDLDEDRCRLWAYNRLHPLELSRAVADCLSCFDGRPIAQVLQMIFAQKGIEMDPQTVKKLYDHRILLEAK